MKRTLKVTRNISSGKNETQAYNVQGPGYSASGKGGAPPPIVKQEVNDFMPLIAMIVIIVITLFVLMMAASSKRTAEAPLPKEVKVAEYPMTVGETFPALSITKAPSGWHGAP